MNYALVLFTIALAVGCSKPTNRVQCISVLDTKVIESVKKAVRPHVEFDREFDGYKHTLEKELQDYELSVLACNETYRAVFEPKYLGKEFAFTGDAKVFVIDKFSLNVVDIETTSSERITKAQTLR